MNGFSINTVPSTVQAPTASSFCFRKRGNRIDWRSLASVDVDRIAREMDFQALQANIMNITFCNIDSEEFHDVDVNFIKLFRLAQLMIEYLLHSQQYLSDLGTQLEQKLQIAQQDLAKVQEQLSTKEDEIKSLKKENRKRRKIIEAYQDMLNAGATGLHTCPVCSREFVSAQYVQSHMHRRHPDHLPPQQKDLTPHINQQEELEKRLLEQMMEQLQVNEKQLRDEMEKREKELVESQAREFEEWKKSEQNKMKMEMQEFKEPILADIKNIQQEKAELEEALQHHQAELQSLKAKKQSHLGHLEGAEELVSDGSKQLAEKARSEVAQMKKQLESQVQEMQSALKKQEKIWKRKMQELGATCQDQIKDSMDKLQTLEHSLHASVQQKDLSNQQALLSQQLASFHQKLKYHEEQLHSQQEQLSSLQSREPSPTPAAVSPAASPSKTAYPRADLEVHVASESEESETTSVNEDEVDSPGFYTPLKHRPEIKTLYDHQPEVLENIKQESLAILDDSMVQRGLTKNAVGISTHQFEESMRTLNQERQQRVHGHYNFTGEREKIKEMVEDVIEKNCQKETNVKEKPQSKKTKLSSSLPVGSQISSKPPKPTSTKNTPQSVAAPVNVVTMVNAATPHPSHSSPPVLKKETVKVESVDSSETEEVLTSESSDVFSESVDHSESHAAQDHPHTKQKDNLDSPWDSEDDSIEELAAQFPTGRTSSTPVKVSGLTTNKAELPVKHDRLGEVQKKAHSSAKEESDDSWDVSELSSPSAPVQSKPILVKTPSLSNKDKPSKQLSQTITGTSQSALTTVSVDDLEDSDFSDWK